MVNALTHSVDEFLNLISQWVKNRADIFGVALVGSYARDVCTKKIVSDGMKILFAPQGILDRLLRAVE